MRKSTRKAAARAAALEREEESRARRLDRRLAQAQALAPLAEDKPELAGAPLRNLWRKKRALLIINTKSGPNHDSIVHVRELVEMLAAFGIRADVRVKLRKSQARKEARAAARKGRYELVIAAGGDGTVESVASGIVGTQTTLGIIPLGTFNNIATCLGIPSDVEQACALLASVEPRRIDVGQVVAKRMKRPRVFMELSAVGLGAALGPLGQDLEKGRWDQAANALPGVMDMSPTPTHVRFDEESGRTSNTLLVTISNSPRAGAALLLAPAARMDDGLLDVCVYDNIDQAGLVGLFLPTAVGAASTPQHSGMLRARARTIEVHTARPMPVSVESKLVGVTPARFSVLTGALSVIAGDGDALLRPASSDVVRASASAAHALAAAAPTNNVPAAPQALVAPSSPGALQVVLPAAGRAIDAAASARPLAVPVIAGVLGALAATLLRPRSKKRFRL